jgi:hypothetical protein
MLPCQSRWSCVTFSTAAAVGSKPLDAFQLEAGELQHPHLRQRVRLELLGQRVQQAGADVAGHRDAAAARSTSWPVERRDGRLAVGAGDREHGGA